MAAATPGIRREDLDRAKGLGIVLVVVGHIVARDYPQDNEWFAWVKIGLYEFHMPFFMYLSGYVAFMTGAARTPLRSWPALAGRRAARLLLPFMIFGLAIALGKLLLAPYLHIDHAPAAGLQDLQNLVWHTDASAAFSIWYMAVLFVLSCVTPLMMWAIRGNTRVLAGIALLLYLVPVPHVMFLDREATYFIFFVAGGLAADAAERWLRVMDRFSGLSLAALLLLASAGVAYQVEVPAKLSLLVCGLVSMPALHGWVRKPGPARSALLLSLGFYSFAIYILNTPCIGLAKGLMWRVVPWDGPIFLVYAPLLAVAGLVGPVLIKRWIFRRVPALDRITQ